MIRRWQREGMRLSHKSFCVTAPYKDIHPMTKNM